MLKKIITVVVIVLTFLTSTVFAEGIQGDDEIAGNVRDLLQGTNSPGAMLSGMPLGYAAADALRDAAETDLAIINGGDIAANLSGGDVTYGEIRAVFHENKAIGIAEVSAADIYEILEAAVYDITVGEDDKIIEEQSQCEGFVQPSGFVYTCDASAAPGNRILSVALDDGEELDPTDEGKRFTLAATEEMLSGGYDMPVIPYVSTELTLVGTLISAVENGTLTQPSGRRVSVVGTRDSSIISMIPIGALLLAGMLFAEYNYKKNTKYDYTRYNHRNEEGYERKKYIRN